MKTAGQPKAPISRPDTNPASAKPIGIPSDARSTNRAFAIAGAKSEHSAIASGMPPPRPRPVRTLTIASCVGEANKGRDEGKNSERRHAGDHDRLAPEPIAEQTRDQRAKQEADIARRQRGRERSRRDAPGIDEQGDNIAHCGDVVAFDQQDRSAETRHAEASRGCGDGRRLDGLHRDHADRTRNRDRSRPGRRRTRTRAPSRLSSRLRISDLFRRAVAISPSRSFAST